MLMFKTHTHTHGKIKPHQLHVCEEIEKSFKKTFGHWAGHGGIGSEEEAERTASRESTGELWSD